MIELDNQTDKTVDISQLQKIADTLTDKEIELILTDDETIRQINSETRQVDKATDVLSFPFDPMPMAPLGSMVISMDHVHKGAETFGHSEADETALLFIHGLLHLLGYDHECDEGEMREEERKLIEKFGLPKSLIVRTEGA
ncbi:MAG: rRNA maturation RNase YbeY [Sulfurimonadaceae bacterium]|nr:rRNA maturation RNase YbeY [Sulfurimonadaceae bacterium]